MVTVDSRREAPPHTAGLARDVKRLGEILGRVLAEQHGPEFLALIEGIRRKAKAERGVEEKEPARADSELRRELEALPSERMTPVARAFATFLNLANLAEQHHRLRRRREYALKETPLARGVSLDASIARARAAGFPDGDIARALLNVRVEIVLTAHPTEVTRRTLFDRYQDIAAALEALDLPHTAEEAARAEADIHRAVTAVWLTDEVRRFKPSPVDEARLALVTVEKSLWASVPDFARTLDAALVGLGCERPCDHVPLRFASWMGGDRDGNPNVTSALTRRVLDMGAWTAAVLFHREVDALIGELSLARCGRLLPERDAATPSPYRSYLRRLRDSLAATRDALGARLAAEGEMPPSLGAEAGRPSHEPAATLRETRELLEPLETVYEDLVSVGAKSIADGRLRDVLVRVRAFGLSLLRLDVRQESGVHERLLDKVTRALGMPPYSSLDEDARVLWLCDELRSPRPLFPRALLEAQEGRDKLDPIERDVVDLLGLIARSPEETFSAYVISMTRRASDVLAVELLKKEFGVRASLPVVPLFETIEDLRAAPGIVRSLLDLPAASSDAMGKRELMVMIGYSDSTKSGGRLASAWELHRTQTLLSDLCAEQGVSLTFFHGRGGSIGRGGGPIRDAISAQPAGTLGGGLRVTEQGEMIQAKLGLPGIAHRTFELYALSILEKGLAPRDAVPPAWEGLMEELARTSRDAFRGLVYGGEGSAAFLDYFFACTPLSELGHLRIGSRPDKRKQTRSVEDLRAIPWIFAWTQTRFLVSSWLGVGEALERARAEGKGPLLREMYGRWDFFRVTIDLLEMVLKKVDRKVVGFYENALMPTSSKPVSDDLHARLRLAEQGVLAVTGRETLLAGNRILDHAIRVRTPYIDPINAMQAELLFRMRRDGATPNPATLEAFLVTVNGIAAGMRNTG